MNFSTLVGFLSALGVFFSALFLSASNFRVFLDLHAVLIVVGGTMAASFICFSLGRVFTLIKVFTRRMLGKNKHDYLGLIDEIKMLSEARVRGNREFESTIKRVSDPFLRDAAEVLFWAENDVTPDKLRKVLVTRASTHYERYLDEADVFRTISKFPPAFGLMGTTLGMIALLQGLGGANAKSTIGPAMSVALVATLYGIVLANFVFLPIAENLTQQSKEDLISRRIVVEGIMLIADNEPTKFIEIQCKSFLLPSERGAAMSGGSSSGSSQRKAA